MDSYSSAHFCWVVFGYARGNSLSAPERECLLYFVDKQHDENVPDACKFWAWLSGASRLSLKPWTIHTCSRLASTGHKRPVFLSFQLGWREIFCPDSRLHPRCFEPVRQIYPADVLFPHPVPSAFSAPLDRFEMQGQGCRAKFQACSSVQPRSATSRCTCCTTNQHEAQRCVLRKCWCNSTILLKAIRSVSDLQGTFGETVDPMMRLRPCGFTDLWR